MENDRKAINRPRRKKRVAAVCVEKTSGRVKVSPKADDISKMSVTDVLAFVGSCRIVSATIGDKDVRGHPPIYIPATPQ